MSAQEATAAPLSLPGPSSSKDHNTPALDDAVTPAQPPAAMDDSRTSPTPPSPHPDPSSSVALAVLQHWSTDLQSPLNAPTAGASSTAGQAAASSNPLVPPQSATNPNAHPLPFQQANQGWFRSLLSSLGIGREATPARKSEMALLWNLCWGFAQVAVISTLVALSGTKWKSKGNSSQTEWEACDRPLGIWACLWIARVVIATGMAYWDFVRVKMARRLQPNAPNAVTGQPAPGVTSNTQPAPALHNNASADPENPFPQPADPPPPVHLPYTHLYSRLTLFSSLLTLSWFLTAHILQYTSLNTCRYTSPHLWWMTFGILCIMYVMVLEVLLLGFIVLVLAPILFVFWNIFLFIIGRHPAQNPHMIKPDIGKLPKSLVDRIPLVMYIPPPPSSKSPDPDSKNNNAENPAGSSPNTEHEYPPQQPELLTQPVPSKKSRFRFFKRKVTKDSKDNVDGGSAQPSSPSGEKEQEVWEGQYEKSEYPFVVLEGNRASCAICLMDFEEPKRKHAHASSSRPTPGEASSSSSPISNQDDAQGELRLTDAGDGAQPLRLLACGHVFHQTCLDPWLTDVSGRCPVCQRPVEAKELKKRKKMNR